LRVPTAVEAQILDLKQVMPAFPKTSQMFNAITVLLENQLLLQMVAVEIEVIKAAQLNIVHSFFQKVSKFISESLVPQVITTPEIVILPMPQVHFLATLLCTAAIRYMHPSQNLQLPGRKCYIDDVGAQVLYHHCCSIWTTLHKQLCVYKLRCKSVVKRETYEQAMQIVGAAFVPRRFAEEHIKEARVSLYREKYGGYRYVGTWSYSLIVAMCAAFEEHHGIYSEV